MALVKTGRPAHCSAWRHAAAAASLSPFSRAVRMLSLQACHSLPHISAVESTRRSSGKQRPKRHSVSESDEAAMSRTRSSELPHSASAESTRSDAHSRTVEASSLLSALTALNTSAVEDCISATASSLSTSSSPADTRLSRDATGARAPPSRAPIWRCATKARRSAAISATDASAAPSPRSTALAALRTAPARSTAAPLMTTGATLAQASVASSARSAPPHSSSITLSLWRLSAPRSSLASCSAAPCSPAVPYISKSR
mmetsp:Transcript_3319/g.10361  ORF Transcript_3319/g.10361 Transcript_3319/m.10361 type:complete len:258 (-) Transcript_3319:1999-2772(-)